jgi:hypothetical protein
MGREAMPGVRLPTSTAHDPEFLSRGAQVRLSIDGQAHLPKLSSPTVVCAARRLTKDHESPSPQTAVWVARPYGPNAARLTPILENAANRPRLRRRGHAPLRRSGVTCRRPIPWHRGSIARLRNNQAVRLLADAIEMNPAPRNIEIECPRSIRCRLRQPPTILTGRGPWLLCCRKPWKSMAVARGPHRCPVSQSICPRVIFREERIPCILPESQS